jgi:hypothetical protein
MAFMQQSARGVGIGIGLALVLVVLYYGLPRLLHWYRGQEERRGLWIAAGRLLAVMVLAGLVLVLLLNAWFTYNRAIDGENAWVCLQRPQSGCGIASPPTPPVSGPAPPAKK